MKKIINLIKDHKVELIGLVGVGVTAAGIIGMKKASAKCDSILEERKQTIINTDICLECADIEYTEQDQQDDVLIANAQATVGIIRAYSIPVLTTVIGGSMIVNSMTKYVTQ